MEKEDRLLVLDVLRAVAVVLVIGRHAMIDWHGYNPVVKTIAKYWREGGWIGVDIFFVLSGFLVSGLLFREHQRTGMVRSGRFLVRRGLKIYPAFYVLLTITIFYQNVLVSPDAWQKIASEFFFVQNYGPTLWNHTWSLAVEEHFYLGLVLLVVLLLRRRGDQADPFRPLIVIFAVLAAGALTWRLNLHAQQRFDTKMQLFATHLRIDSLFFGVLLSYFYSYHKPRFVAAAHRFRWPLVVGGTALLVPPFFVPLGSGSFLHTIGLSLHYLGAGMLLIGLLVCDFPRNRLTRFVGWVGLFSYSIYLWHMPVQRWVMPRLLRYFELRPDASENLLIYTLLSVGIGIAMARLIELPVLKVRDRLWPAQARFPTASVRAVRGEPSRGEEPGGTAEPRPTVTSAGEVRVAPQ